MRKITFFILVLIATSNIFAQTLLAKWTFPTGTGSDSLADGGIAANLTRVISTGGGVSAIDFSTNGYTTKSAKATQWDNGMDTKYWIVDISTIGYDSITISSKHHSGGNNPGPRDFKLQYKSGGAGAWTDVPGTSLVLASDWTAVLDSVPLPSACDDKNHIYLRWIMTSNVSSTGGTILPTGLSKIDDIYIYGKVISGINNVGTTSFDIKVLPNPAKEMVSISSTENISSISIINIIGKKVIEVYPDRTQATINIENLDKGLYIINVNIKNLRNPYIHKLIVE